MHPRPRQLAFILLAFIALFMFAAPAAQAQDYIPLAPIAGPGIDAADQFTSCRSSSTYNSSGVLLQEADCLPKYLTTLYNMGIALAGLFLVFAIVRGGFTLMFTDSVLGKLEGKKIILQAMGGAVIVFSSYLLMNTINPQLAKDLNLSLKFPRVKIEKFVSRLKPVPADTRTEMQKILAEGRENRYVNAEQSAHQLLADADIAEQLGEEDLAWEMRSQAYNLVLEAGAALSRAEISNAVQALPQANTARARLDRARANALTALNTMDRGYGQNLPALEDLADIDNIINHYTQWNIDKSGAYAQIAEMYIENADAYGGGGTTRTRSPQPDATQHALSMMGGIKTGAENAYRNLKELERIAVDDADKLKFNNAAEKVKSDANAAIKRIKSACADFQVPRTTFSLFPGATKPAPLPCKDASISI